jgi:hypothetical protein
MAEKVENTTTQASGCVYCETVRPLMERFWSDVTRDHFRASRVEFLKGVRSILDARIARLSKESHKGTHVVVE